MVSVRVTKLRPSAKIPKYMSIGAAGCDITACLDDAPIVIAPHQRVAVPTGIAVEIPEGFEIQVRPRSGYALKKGLTVVNAPGTIDSDYRGELMVLLINLSDDAVTVEPGDRIAQLVLQKVQRIEWVDADTLSETQRATGGFGSTGLKDTSTPL